MYCVVKNLHDDRNVYVTKHPAFDDWEEINDDASLLDRWPEDVTFQYSDDRPEGVILTDHITNTINWLIASEKFKNSLVKLELDYLEFLPVGFIDHKGRARNKPYWIVNFTKLISAIDREQSEFREVSGDTLDFFKKLVLTEEIEKTAPYILFERATSNVFFREDYKAEIEWLGLTGFRLIATNDYMTINPHGP